MTKIAPFAGAHSSKEKKLPDLAIQNVIIYFMPSVLLDGLLDIKLVRIVDVISSTPMFDSFVSVQKKQG